MRSGINKGGIQERYLLRGLRGGHMKLISLEGKSAMKEICNYLRYEKKSFLKVYGKPLFQITVRRNNCVVWLQIWIP